MSEADQFAGGDWNAQCYRCGRKFKASTMRKQWQGFWVCQNDWEPRQPQDFVRAVPDNPAAPWVQPVSDEYVGPPICTLSGRSAMPGLSMPGCLMPGRIPSDESPYPVPTY